MNRNERGGKFETKVASHLSRDSRHCIIPRASPVKTSTVRVAALDFCTHTHGPKIWFYRDISRLQQHSHIALYVFASPACVPQTANIPYALKLASQAILPYWLGLHAAVAVATTVAVSR